jgi:DNA-binding protein Fis
MRYLIITLTLLLFTACIGDKKPKKEVTEELNTTNVVTTVDTNIETLTLKQTQLKSALDNYFAQLNSLNADNIISMTYPRLFIPIKQDMFRDYLNTMLISSDVKVNSFDSTIVEIGTIKPFSEGEFAQINYNSTININFINPELYNTQRKLLILDKILSNKYGRENIRVDSIGRTITIKKEEKLLAIKDTSQEWKFLGDNEEYRRLYPRILPIDILNSI